MNQQPLKLRPQEPETNQQECFSADDYAKYYSRQAEGEEAEVSRFAPPVRLSTELDMKSAAPSNHEQAEDQSTNYRRRRNTNGYVQEEYQPVSEKSFRKEKNGKKWLWWILFVVAGVFVVILFFSPKITNNIEEEDKTEETFSPTQTVLIQATPEISAYRDMPEAVLNTNAQAAILSLAPGLQFDQMQINSQNVLVGQMTEQSLYDYYLFSADKGRLIAYFENIPKDGAFFQENGDLYVRQPPFVMTPEGKAVIRSKLLEDGFGEHAVLHPFYHGWAAVEDSDRGEWNFLNASGDRYNNMEYARVFPFSGQYTVAYLDTGNVGNDRYLVFILDSSGVVSRWKTADTVDDIVVSLNNMAYTQNGELYNLVDFSTPMLSSSSVTFYPNFDAMVVQDASTSKYSLYIHGKLYYDCEYFSIQPMPSDLPWKTIGWSGNGNRVLVCALDTCMTNPPSACSFALQGEKETEYVSLSLTSRDPLLYQGELPNLTEVLP